MSYTPSSHALGDYDLEHFHGYESTSEVLDGSRLEAMRRIVNAWEWLGTGQGGENPHRHEAGWFPVGDMVITVVRGPATGHWLAVKCDRQEITAKEFNRLTRRAVPRRMRRNPDGVGSYEMGYTWLEPLECWTAGSGFDLPDVEINYENGEECVQHASNWAQELRTAWALEEEGSGWDRELSVDPHRMEWLRRSVEADAEATLDEALERLATLEDVAREEAALG